VVSYCVCYIQSYNTGGHNTTLVLYGVYYDRQNYIVYRSRCHAVKLILTVGLGQANYSGKFIAFEFCHEFPPWTNTISQIITPIQSYIFYGIWLITANMSVIPWHFDLVTSLLKYIQQSAPKTLAHERQVV